MYLINHCGGVRSSRNLTDAPKAGNGRFSRSARKVGRCNRSEDERREPAMRPGTALLALLALLLGSLVGLAPTAGADAPLNGATAGGAPVSSASVFRADAPSKCGGL